MKPVITLNGVSPMNVVQGGTYTEPGATWADNVDGSGTVTAITGSVNTATVGTYTISYNKTDAAGNVATTVTRTVNVTLAPDVTPPVITLNGASVMNVDFGTSYTELGATWTDAVDGSGAATVSGTVNTLNTGTYTKTYNKTDAAGNIATPVTRTINVVCPIGTLDLGD